MSSHITSVVEVTVIDEVDSPSREAQRAVAEKPSAEETPAEEEYQTGSLTLLMLCAVSALEGADTALLPSCQMALANDIDINLTSLAILGTVQTVMTNLAAPFWGILADRKICERRTILVLGSLGQGLVTIALAWITGMMPMVFLRGLNGVFLASLRPICNGIVADTTSDHRRGKIFGRVQCAWLFGMFVSQLAAGNMARKEILGFQGWRVAYVISGVIALVVGWLVRILMTEPKGTDSEAENLHHGSPLRVFAQEIRRMLSFFTIPTFCIMIMQGIFGTIPWSVMGNSMLYFQLTGMDDGHASVLTSEGTVTGMFGNLLGGMVADALARRFGYHGRPLSAQITVAIGIPMIYLQFYGIPAGAGSFGIYFALIAGFGILGAWAQSGTNFPILSDIVPPADRSKVMAWEGAFENSIATALGNILIAFLAETCFGFKFGKVKAEGEADLPAASALGQAMTLTICVPWCICFLAYGLLHWSYPRDMKRARQNAKPASKTAEEKTNVV